MTKFAPCNYYGPSLFYSIVHMSKCPNVHMSMSVSVSVSMDTDTHPHRHMDIQTYGHGYIDIWTYGHGHMDLLYGHLDIWMKGHVAVMHDMTTVYTLFRKFHTGNVQNKKNMGICRSFQTFIHFRCFVTLDVLSSYVLSQQTFCPYTFYHIIPFGFLDVLFVYVLSQYTFCRYQRWAFR